MGKDRSLLRHRKQFWQLMEKEHEKARRYCFKLAGGSDEGDDLYQDAVIRAYNGFPELRQPESFRPWVYKIINNAYKARFRNRWWQKVTTLPPKIIDGMKTENPTALYDARCRLNYAMESLTPDDRIIVTMAELEGWKITELAHLYSKTEGFVKMRLFRARKKMRKKLGGLYIREGDGKFNEEI
jgi:RNA polymerase sigma-70 factor (ECF subfamily)